MWKPESSSNRRKRVSVHQLLGVDVTWVACLIAVARTEYYYSFITQSLLVCDAFAAHSCKRWAEPTSPQLSDCWRIGCRLLWEEEADSAPVFKDSSSAVQVRWVYKTAFHGPLDGRVESLGDEASFITRHSEAHLNRASVRWPAVRCPRA